MAFATVAAERGHKVTLFEKKDQIGGQFNLAKKIPGKEIFQHTLDYFNYQLQKFNVTILLNTEATIDQLQDFDEIVIASGIKPRIPNIKGIEHTKVMSYVDVITGQKEAGNRVAIIGAGGIGFDVAEFLTHEHPVPKEQFYNEWGIDIYGKYRGGIKPAEITPSPREVYLLQRKKKNG